jgi:CHASE3 domain sensor protein
MTTALRLERVRKARGPVPIPIGIAFAIALLAIILDAVLVHRLVLETRQLAEGVRRTRVATARLLAVHQLLVDAETGERGYLLTGRDDYLAPYTSGIERLQTALTELEQSFDLTERDRADYQTLARLAKAKQETRWKRHRGRAAYTRAYRHRLKPALQLPILVVY